MHATDSWERFSKSACLALPGTYKLPHPAFSPILPCAKYSLRHDGDKKVGYLMQEARPFQAPLRLLQYTNTLLTPIFPKSSSHLPSNSESKWPFRQTFNFQAPTHTKVPTLGPSTTWVSALNSSQKSRLPKGGLGAALPEGKTQQKPERARSPGLQGSTVLG